MKSNLLDLTFLIPVRIESIARLENIIAVITFLRRHFYAHIVVLEASDGVNNFLRKLLPKDIEYYFVEDNDPVFYRTFYLNQMALKVCTQYLAIWDADVVVYPQQIEVAIGFLRAGKADVVFPYDGRVLDTTPIIRNYFLKSLDIKILSKHNNKMNYLYDKERMKGGGVIVNTEKYKLSGMENINFYGWGPEDSERYVRWENIDYLISRIDGCMYHLTHPRNINGTYNSFQQGVLSNRCYNDSCLSSKEELLNIKNCIELF